MIESKDLRIGNWVDTLYNVPYIKITEIKEAVICGENCKGMSYGSLKPIPLSEEVLLKCNFIAYANVLAYELRDLDLSIDVNFTKSGGYIVSISDEKSDFSRVLSTTMKLHELQNLIASFGEELEVSL